MMPVRRIQACCLLAALLTPLCAADHALAQGQDMSTELGVDPAVITGTLENGLRYFIRQNGRPEARAELRLIVNAGSVLEDDDQRGLAHLVEHMAFNGTANFEKQELVDYLESIGMQFGPSVNAFTSFDETVYMLRVPTDDEDILATGFQILEDWAYQVSFDPEEIDKERGVVIEEWRLGRGANARIQDKQFPVIYSGSLYAERLPIGTVETLQSFEHERLTSFYHDWYRPGLMAVVAVGDFDPARIEEAIVEHFSRVPVNPDPPPRFMADVPDHSETLTAIATDAEATNSTVVVLYKQPLTEGNTIGDYRRSLVEQLYNAMFNARLRELSQQADAPYLFGASGQGRMVRAKEFYQLFAAVREGGHEAALDALITEAERVARHGFTGSELERAKTNALRGMEQAYADRETRESRTFASEYRSAFLYGEAFPGIEAEYTLYQTLLPTIEVAEIDRLAREWLVDENRVILADGPERDGESTVASAEALLAIFDEVAGMEITAYEDAVTDAPLLASTPMPSAVTEESYIAEIDVTEWQLANGVRVLLKPTDFEDDQILFRAYSPGGTSLVDDEDIIPASTASQIVSEGGLGAFDQIDLQKKLAGKAAGARPFIGSLTEGMSGGASPQDVETMFQLIYGYFTEPRQDETAFGVFQNRMTAFLENRNANPMAAFFDTISVTMSQNDPRSQPPSIEMFEQMDLAESFAFYQDRFADASDFTFVFVGKFTLDEIKPLVETYLGGLPSTGRVETWRDMDSDPPTGVIRKTVRRGVEPKSQTQIIFTGDFQYDSENRLAIRSLADLLSITLRETLREDLGGTYSVSARPAFSQFPEATYRFTIDFGADPARLDDLVATVFREIEALQATAPSEEDVQKVRETQRRSRETSLQRNQFWVGQLLSSDQNGIDPRRLASFDFIDQITPELIQHAANLFLRLDNFVQVSLYPEAVVP